MLKRFTLVASAMAGLAALLAACSGGTGGNTPEPGTEGEAQVSVKGLSAYEIQSMVVTAQPANVTQALAYSPDAGTFNGTLVLPVGPQMLTANGYAYVGTDAGTPDGGSDAGSGALALVATGFAPVEIVANTTTGVSMRIYDQTPPPPQPDFAPIIRSMTVSRVNPGVNEPIHLTVDALDLDGDPLSYFWTSSCLSGSFDQRDSSMAMWLSTATGQCTITVSVSARGATVTESVTVVVFSGDGGGTGGAQVNGEYIPRPQVTMMTIYNGGDLPYSSAYRNGANANLPNVGVGRVYTIDVSYDFGTRIGLRHTDLQASCGVLMRGYDSCNSNSYTSCYVQYQWTTPPQGAACRLTASVMNDMLMDSFTAGILVK